MVRRRSGGCAPLISHARRTDCCHGKISVRRHVDDRQSGQLASRGTGPSRRQNLPPLAPSRPRGAATVHYFATDDAGMLRATLMVGDDRRRACLLRPGGRRRAAARPAGPALYPAISRWSMQPVRRRRSLHRSSADRPTTRVNIS